MKRRLLLTVFTFALFIVVLPVISFGAQNIFVSIDGMSGESTDSDHTGWIDAFAYSGGVTATGSLPGTGSGKATFNDIKILKFIDKTTPKLYMYTSTGMHISNVKIDIMRTDGSNTLLEKVILKDVIITGVNTTVQDGKAIEEVSLNFGRISLVYQSAAGVINRTCFDLMLNAQCNTGGGAAAASEN